MNHGHNLHNLHSVLDHGWKSADIEVIPIPNAHFQSEITPTLEKRTPDSTHPPSSTCTPGDQSARCALPTSTTSTTTIPIALGVVIPLVSAFAIFIYLHRRHVKKQRQEDANDKYGSLDFGLGESRGRIKGKKKKGSSAMAGDHVSAEELRPGRGMSMDMGSPYVLPGDFQTSRGSFHSLSKSAHDGEDPYHSVAFVKSESSMRHYSSSKDNSSVLTASSESTSLGMTNLLRHAQNPPRSTPPVGSRASTPLSDTPPDILPYDISEPVPALPHQGVGIPSNNPYEIRTQRNFKQEATFVLPVRQDPARPPSKNYGVPKNFDRSLNSSKVTSRVSEERRLPPPLMAPQASSNRLPTMVSMDTEVVRSSIPGGLDRRINYGDVLGIAQDPLSGPTQSKALTTIHEPMPSGLGVAGLPSDTRRLSSSLRPLPPDDPTDNAEQRANRIRSFYREYFDDSKVEKADRTGPRGEYYEDYGQEYLNGATIYDPATGQFILAGAPFAQPVTRRAMTPPPRAPPRFRAGPEARRSDASSGTAPVGRVRAYSSASGQPQMGFRGRAPKQQLPLPAPLTTLPTPSMLRDDSSTFSPLDFAPPPSVKDRRAGRSSSPRGEQRPYSPTVRAHTPLASPFDDLAAMPSPHALRESSTFTGLDFASSPRFRNGEANTGSDGGSILSARSGNLSPMQHANIRAGAYRVSRIQKDIVGTKDDFATSLKPTWELRAP